MHEPHQVVAYYPQSWGCGQEQRPTSTLEGVDAAHFGQMVPSSQVKWFPCWGVFSLDYAWQIIVDSYHFYCCQCSWLLKTLFLHVYVVLIMLF